MDRRFQQISQHQLFFHKKIAWIYIAIVFDHRITAAPVLEGADLRFDAHSDHQNIFDKPYRGHRMTVVIPDIEQNAKKITVVLHRHRVVRHFSRTGIPLDTRDELQPGKSVPDEKVLELSGLFTVASLTTAKMPNSTC
jgi:hypothetical protein